MIFQVDWHPQAAKNLSKLPKELIQRVLDKLDEVKEDPFRYSKSAKYSNIGRALLLLGEALNVRKFNASSISRTF